MSDLNKKPCPTCSGHKVIQGVCETSPEWRGSTGAVANDDSKCTPDSICPTCHGKGYEE